MQANIEKELRKLYPQHSVYQIRPLGRAIKRLLYRVDDINVRIQNTLKRYGVSTITEVEKIRDLIYTIREQRMLQGRFK